MNTTTRRVQKARERHAKRKLIRRHLAAAICQVSKSDPRVFAEIEIKGQTLRGLLDTGASVNILANRCRELVENLELEVLPFYSVVKTAAGQQHSILGKVNVEVSQKNEKRIITFYLCRFF